MTKQANQLKEGDLVIVRIDGNECLFQVNKIFTFSALDFCYLDLIRVNFLTGKLDNQTYYGYFPNEKKFELYAKV